MGMAALARIGLAVALVAVVFAAGQLGAFASLDRVTLDARFALTSRPASGQVVFVDIDSASLRQVGVWPWPRQVHAQLLDRLMELGAAEVAFDIDFSASSTAEGDAAFAQSLENAGGYALLAAFEQMDGATSERQLNLPIPALAAHAAAVAVNVSAGPDGLIDRMPSSIAGAGTPIPSLPVALSGQADRVGDIYFDYGIALETVDRIPAGDILSEQVDPGRIFGRQVIVGASAIELRDTFNVPRYGILPGPMLQIAGLETLKANRSLTPLGTWPLLIVALLLGLAVTKLPLRVALVGASVTIVGTEVTALLLQWIWGITLKTAAFDLSLLTLVGMQLARAFAIEYAERHRAQAELIYLARHDPVTGVLSRRGLVERMAAGSGGALMLGVRRLDLVRGTLGQPVAEGALRQIAGRLDELGFGVLGLVDRDVFAIAFPGRPTGGLEGMTARIRAVLTPALMVEGHAVHADIAVAADLTVGRLDAQLRRAELALRAVPGAATTGVTVFEAAHERAVDRRRRIDAAMRQAIVRRELSVVFQPQERFADGALVGVEALVRWNSAELGWVSPAEFIPLAEETGLIVQLGAFVMTEACRAAAEWDWDGRVAVNISAEQFRLDDIGEMVADALMETGFDAARLDLEITESILVAAPGQLTETMAALRTLGVGVAIDDFGTGYSALSYLSTMDFDKLKIDQSFVRSLEADTPNAAVVQTIIDLGKRLGRTVIAEGVETDEQRRLLIRMGCDVGQGYFIGRPMPANDIAARIASTRAAIA